MLIKPRLKAGCIVYRKYGKAIEFLLLYRQNKNDWSFPKGRLEEGESFEQAAVRELKEETGLDVILEQRLPDLVYLVDSENEPRHDITALYIARVDKGDFNDRIETNEFPEWVKIEEVEDRLSYQTLKEYFIENRDKLNKLV